MQAQPKENIKYRLIAKIGKLHLNKNLNFETKVTWKRNVNKAQTQIVTHQNFESDFNENLELEINLVYDTIQAKFEPKYTQFSIVVIYQGKVKSGGYAKYDAAEIVNKNYVDQTIQLKLIQCPDPEAYLDITFNYEVLSESSRSLFNQLSMLNPSGMENDLSQIDFQDDYKRRTSRNSNTMQLLPQQLKTEIQNQANKQNENPSSSIRQSQIQKINHIIDKIEDVSRKIKNSPKSVFKDDHNQTKNQSLEISVIPHEQEERLRGKIADLQKQLENREELIEQYQRDLKVKEKQIEELILKLELSQSLNKQNQQIISTKNIDIAIVQSENKYKLLYESTYAQLQEIKNNAITDTNFSKQSAKFKKFLEEVNDVDQIPSFMQHEGVITKQKEQLELLEIQNVQLQNKIAEISNNIAELFNAAYDYGGSKLLDHLQNSIGLIEQQS